MPAISFTRSFAVSFCILAAAGSSGAPADQPTPTAAAGGSPAALPTTVVLTPAKDNTLYESPTGSLSNGQGSYMFSGRTGTGAIRRALVAFDVASAVPAGSDITSVTLQMNMSRTIVGPFTVRLHRVLADWGEGTSNDTLQEGNGAPSTIGDATWIHRFYDSTFWSSAGGDFAAAASAGITVNLPGPYTWGSSAEMVADVQSWVDDPASSFGWILIGDESVAPTTKRFDSSENAPAVQPRLTIQFNPPGRCCYNIGPGTGDCSDGITQPDCEALPQGVGTNVFVAGELCLGDGDEDGVDDSCPLCGIPAAPQLGKIDGDTGPPVVLVAMRNNRSLAIEVPGSAARPQAVEVHFLSLPAPWDLWNGTRMWVTTPIQACETGGVGLGDACPPTSPTFWAAGLACDSADAAYIDWTSLGTVYVFHPGILPSSPGATGLVTAEYEVRTVDATCDPSDAGNFSAAASVIAPRWGDLAGPIDASGSYYVAADGRVDIPVDVVAILAKFTNRSNAPAKARADLEPCKVDFKLNMTDVVRALDAFRGVGYPFTPTSTIFGCVSTDPCFYSVP